MLEFKCARTRQEDMPTLAVYTNVHKAHVPDDFVSEASKVFQAAIGKPMEVGYCYYLILIQV